MMKLRSHIATLALALLLIWTAGAHAAAVVPSAATNYCFSTPLRPAHIRGLVMGVPPAYYEPRCEDWDWLAEAFEERSALSTGVWVGGESTVLVPEFGKWGVAETNRFHKWVLAVDAAGVTNVVVGYNLVTNSPPSRGPGPSIPDASHRSLNPGENWLDGATELLYGHFAIPTDDESQTFTNVVYSQSFTNAVTNAFSLITMPMTNGTVSVHTNKWAAEITVPADIQAHTNVTVATLVDFCQADPTRSFPGAFDALPELPEYAFPTIHEVLSNFYVRLRLAVRLHGIAESAASTYTVVNDYYNWDGSSSSREYQGGTYFQFSRGSSNERWYAKPFDSILTTGFRSDLVTTGRAERVTIDAAFRIGRVQYVRSGGSPGGYTNINVTVITRVSFPEHLTTTGPFATVSIREDALAEATADTNAAGHGIPNMPALSDTSSNTSDYFRYSKPTYVIIYGVHPTSKFVDW